MNTPNKVPNIDPTMRSHLPRTYEELVNIATAADELEAFLAKNLGPSNGCPIEFIIHNKEIGYELVEHLIRLTFVLRTWRIAVKLADEIASELSHANQG